MGAGSVNQPHLVILPPRVPMRVAIKEYVDVAGAFFGATECGMINAVLDRLAKQSRPKEAARG